MNAAHPHMQSHDALMAAMIVDLALARGWSISVNDGEEWAIKRSTDGAAIFAAMASTEMDSLRFRFSDGPIVGTYLLIYGNSPGELIADSTLPDSSPEWQEFCDKCDGWADVLAGE